MKHFTNNVNDENQNVIKYCTGQCLKTLLQAFLAIQSHTSPSQPTSVSVQQHYNCQKAELQLKLPLQRPVHYSPISAASYQSNELLHNHWSTSHFHLWSTPAKHTVSAQTRSTRAIRMCPQQPFVISYSSDGKQLF